MSKRFENWKARVAFWRAKYKIPNTPFPKNDLRHCVRCLTHFSLTRHHKGHEYYFACIDEATYAPRYLRFHAEDIVDLCEKHHRYLHKRYKPTIDECNTYLLTCRPYRVNRNEVKYLFEPSHEVLESYRQRLIHICNKFLERKSARSTRK